MEDRARLGLEGERRAERYLRRRLRYRLVARRYRCPAGEIDLVALDGRTIVFVEVKTRRDARHADPEDAVTPSKQGKLIRSAKCFVQQTGSHNRGYRFDVVAVTQAGPKQFNIEHFPNAFGPTS